MSNAQIHNMLTERFWLDGLKAIEEQYEEADGARRRWIRIGNGLLIGRQRCPADQDFGTWLDTTGYRVIARDERQDAMWLAVNEQIALRALAETRIGNPCRARRHIRDNLPEIYSKCADAPSVTNTFVTATSSPSLVEPPQNETVEPEETCLPVSDTNESAPQLEPSPSVEQVNKPNPDTLPRVAGGPRKWRLDKKPDADLVRAHITSGDCRKTFADYVLEKGAGPLWDLLVYSIKQGYYGPPAKGCFSPSLTAIMPWHPNDAFARSFDLRQLRWRDEVERIIFPLLDKCGAEIRAEPGKLADMVRAERRRLAEERHAAIKQARHQEVLNTYKFKTDEQEIIAFGEPLWPQDSPQYTYAELCSACWYVNFWIRLAAAVQWTPLTTGMQGRHLVKYIEPVSRGLMLAIFDLLNAYQQNPEGKTVFPPIPLEFR